MLPAVRRRRGNVLVLFAILLTSLIGMVAFAIDTGYIALYKTRLQRAADAAALAGATKALTIPGESPDPDGVRAEVRKYVTFNMPGLTVRDEDIKFCRYTPYYAPENRFTYNVTTAQPANGIDVTLRRDTLQNDPLRLFFAPVIGTRTASLTARSVAYCAKGKSVKASAPFLPYTMQYDYYYAAMGQTRTGVDDKTIQVRDDYTVNPTTLAVSSGKDDVNEVLLFSDRQNTPGNWGSLDIGSLSNATGELTRQILYGPTEADFANPDFYVKVNPTDGALYVPFVAGGDSGVSNDVRTAFNSIKGQPRIIPLFGYREGIDPVKYAPYGKYGTGNTSEYNIIGYAGVVITSVDFNGNPKTLTVQPAFLVSNKVTAAQNDTDAVVEGVYLPPKLVIP